MTSKDTPKKKSNRSSIIIGIIVLIIIIIGAIAVLRQPGATIQSTNPTATPTTNPSPLPNSQIPAVGASASSYNGLTYSPLNAIDGVESISNYWGTSAVSGLPQWLKIDVGFAAGINQVVTHFYDGNTRVYTYFVEVSVDGSLWTTVVASKTGSSIVTDTFNQVTARFVRITVTGNTANAAAHIEEIKIYQSTNPTPTGGSIVVSSATASSFDSSHLPNLAIDGIESASNYWGTNALLNEGKIPQWL